MKLKYIGFGGNYIKYPCYEDENGNVYFDINDGKNGLNICNGAFKDIIGEIYGEPCSQVKEPIECNEPFVRHERETDYMMLARLRTDCNYFLGNGNGYNGHLYYKDVNTQCNKMLELYNSFKDEDKPQWITVEQIEQYRKDMLAKKSE